LDIPNREEDSTAERKWFMEWMNRKPPEAFRYDSARRQIHLADNGQARVANEDIPDSFGAFYVGKLCCTPEPTMREAFKTATHGWGSAHPDRLNGKPRRSFAWYMANLIPIGFPHRRSS